MEDNKKTINGQDLAKCLELLDQISQERKLLSTLSEEQRVTLFKVCGKISRPSKEEKKETHKKAKKEKRKLQIIQNKSARPSL
jgi:hypothetical protein